MASPLFAFALLIHQQPLTPPACEGFVVPKGKMEYTSSKLQPKSPCPPPGYIKESLDYKSGIQREEEPYPLPLTFVFSFPSLETHSFISPPLYNKVPEESIPPLMDHPGVPYEKQTHVAAPLTSLEIPSPKTLPSEFKPDDAIQNKAPSEIQGLSFSPNIGLLSPEAPAITPSTPPTFTSIPSEKTSLILLPIDFIPPRQRDLSPSSSWAIQAPALDPLPLGKDLAYPTLISSEETPSEAVFGFKNLKPEICLPDYTPPSEVTIAQESFDLKTAPYYPPEGYVLATAHRNQTLLAAPAIGIGPEVTYNQTPAIASLFPAHKEHEFPFIAKETPISLYNASYPVITQVSLTSGEPSLPSLFQYTYPPISRSEVAPVLRNHSAKEYNLSRQPTSDQLNNVAFDDQFEVSVGVMPRNDQKGFLFHVNLYPKANLTLNHMKQNFVFVIDKSSSIKQFRYDIFRRAVIDSLDYLQEGDTFNIYVVDNKTHKLSEEPLLWRKSSVRKAKEFLFSQDFNKYYSSSADAYDVIDSVQDDMAPFEGELTVIFVTDGSSLMDIRKRKHTLSHLIYSNKKTYTLHTACMSKDSSGSMLDLLSTFNRGEFISSQTHAAFPRKFCRLVKHVSQIITKDIHLSTLSGSSVTLFPSAAAMPQMYVDRPFTIYGTIDQLEDFDLIVQGKFDDRYLYMKKKIHLKTAPRSTKPLQKQLAIHQAYLCYEHYLNEHDEFYLEEAKKQLAKYKLRAAVDKNKK